MLSEEVKIQYEGFEPTHDMRSSLYIILNKLHLKAPSQSFLSASFTLTNGIFEGAIKITSAAENFMAKATDVQLSELCDKLAGKVDQQIVKWKALRF